MTTTNTAATPQTTPQTNNFAPNLGANQTIIAKFTPGKFDSLIKVLSVLDDKGIIVINKSLICQLVAGGNGILETDISNLSESQRIDFHILNPKKYLKLFRQMKGNNDIYLIDDPNERRYIIDNGMIQLHLPKQIEEFDKDAEPPNLEGVNMIGSNVVLTKDQRTAFTAIGDSNHVDLLISDNQLKGFYVPDTAIVRFPDYTSVNLQLDNCIKLSAYTFLTVPGEDTKIFIGVRDNSYWMVQDINTGFIHIRVCEALQPVTEESMLI